MTDDERRHEEDAVGAHWVVHLDVYLVQRHDLAFVGDGFAHDLHVHGGTDDHALPQVPKAKHEAQLVVSDANNRVLTEDERLRAPVRLRRFHEDASQHDGIDHQTDDVLDDQYHDGRDALLRDHPPSKTNGHLDFDGEQKRGGERVDVAYARHKVVLFRVQISVRERDEPPDHPKQEPTAQVRHGEDHERVKPF